MTKTINSIKLFLCLLFCFVSSLIIISFFNSFSVTEVKATVCGNSNWVIKSSDYTGQGVNINYGDVGSGHDRKISVSAETGYVINEIWLDVDNDGHSGYYQYASGPLNNYNPNPGDEIFDAKVKVTYNCPATPTPTPTATPTPTHGCPTRTPTPTHGCYPTHACPTNTPTLTPIPTETPVESPTETPVETPVNTPTITNTPAPTDTPSSGGDNGSSNPGPPTCNDADPGAPSNLRAVALGGGKVKLTWDNAPGPHTSYAVAYGPSEGNYLYGDPNVGNVTSYTVLALNPGGKYCFYVQAQNGCKGGTPSNVVCTNQGVGSFRVLGVTDNYNPLVDGIKESYGGEVLGESTELMGTAEVVYSSEKLPSGNTLLEGQSISIPAIGVNQALYQPQIIADQLAVGQHEVLNTTVNGSNVFYGHNGFDVFGSLYRVVKGNQIIVNSGLQKLTYTVVSTHFVNKNDVSVLKTDANQIVLVTCSYTQPDYRIVVKALLQP